MSDSAEEVYATFRAHFPRAANDIETYGPFLISTQDLEITLRQLAAVIPTILHNEGQLEGDVINLYLHQLNKEYGPMIAIHSYTGTRIADGLRQSRSFEKLFKASEDPNRFENALHLWPLHVNSLGLERGVKNHWILIIVDWTTMRVNLFDSCNNPEAYVSLGERIIQYYIDNYKESQLARIDFSLRPRKTAVEENGPGNCGVFVLMTAASVVNRLAIMSYEDFRTRLTLELLLRKIYPPNELPSLDEIPVVKNRLKEIENFIIPAARPKLISEADCEEARKRCNQLMLSNINDLVVIGQAERTFVEKVYKNIMRMEHHGSIFVFRTDQASQTEKSAHVISSPVINNDQDNNSVEPMEEITVDADPGMVIEETFPLEVEEFFSNLPYFLTVEERAYPWFQELLLTEKRLMVQGKPLSLTYVEPMTKEEKHNLAVEAFHHLRRTRNHFPYKEFELGAVTQHRFELAMEHYEDFLVGEERAEPTHGMPLSSENEDYQCRLCGCVRKNMYHAARHVLNYSAPEYLQTADVFNRFHPRVNYALLKEELRIVAALYLQKAPDRRVPDRYRRIDWTIDKQDPTLITPRQDPPSREASTDRAEKIKQVMTESSTPAMTQPPVQTTSTPRATPAKEEKKEVETAARVEDSARVTTPKRGRSVKKLFQRSRSKSREHGEASIMEEWIRRGTTEEPMDIENKEKGKTSSNLLDSPVLVTAEEPRLIPNNDSESPTKASIEPKEIKVKIEKISPVKTKNKTKEKTEATTVRNSPRRTRNDTSQLALRPSKKLRADDVNTLKRLKQKEGE